MTSTASSRGKGMVAHDFRVAFTRLVPVLVAALCVFAVLMPVSTAAVADLSVFNVEYTHDQLKFRFFAEDLLPCVIGAAVVLGVACGVRSFGFLLVRRESTALLSLPLSRTTLFATRFGADVIVIVLSIGIALAASLAVNVAALGTWPGEAGQFCYVLVGLVLTALVACAVAVCCCALCRCQGICLA